MTTCCEIALWLDVVVVVEVKLRDKTLYLYVKQQRTLRQCEFLVKKFLFTR